MDNDDKDTVRFWVSMAAAIALIGGGFWQGDLAVLTIGVGIAGFPSYMKATKGTDE